MAVELPTTRTRLRPELCRRGRPILSGAQNADADAGSRGISRALNHAYAYRTRLIASHWPSDDAVEFTSGAIATGSFTDIFGVFWRRAPNVRVIRVTAWVAGGTWRGHYDGVNGGGTLVGTTPAKIVSDIA